VNSWIMFVFGLLIGWLIEWLIDWFYWRRRYRILTDKNSSCQENVLHLKNELKQIKENSAVKTGNIKAEVVIPDDLEVIKGIGPVIAGKLNEAGIYTFEQLGAIDAIQLRHILGKMIERLADEEDLLEQARSLAHQKEAGQK
jgi:predicted flap endonuclease-1-like 5' DNA nuclease